MKRFHAAATVFTFSLLLAGCGGTSTTTEAKPAVSEYVEPDCWPMNAEDIRWFNDIFDAYGEGESIASGMKSYVDFVGPGKFRIAMFFAAEVQPSGDIALFGRLRNPSGKDAGEVPLNKKAQKSWPDARAKAAERLIACLNDASPTIDAPASETAASQTPSSSLTSVTSQVRVCQQVQADYIIATRKARAARTDAMKARVSALVEEGIKLDCRLKPYGDGDGGPRAGSD